MVYKRPATGRNQQNNRSQSRPSNTGNRPQRPAKTRKTTGPDEPGDFKPSRRGFSKETPDAKKSFKSAGGPKKFQGDKAKQERSFDRPFSKFEKPLSKGVKSKPRSKDFDQAKPERAGYSKPAPEGKSFDKPFSRETKSKGRGKNFDQTRPERGGYSKPASRNAASAPNPPAKVLRGRKKAAEPQDDGLIRLNRYISNAGICSRRKADELITAGVISVNGEVISELGFKVDPSKDVVRYNGETLKREKMVYVLLNKPKDYITTTDDPQERRTVMHLVEKASKERIYPIGRLDRNTTGLLLMTNDGELADKLSHPRNNIVKLYQAELSKSLTQGDLNKIAFGVELEDGFVKPDAISYVSGATKREVGIQIHSGKNRIVRRIFEHLGYEVVKLDRVVYANLTKKDLPRGRWRYLEESEIIQLKHLI